jgi:hypothetical protein
MSRAPEEPISGESPNGDRNASLGSQAHDSFFHCGRVCASRHRHVGVCFIQRLNVLLEGVVGLRVHAGPALDAAGFVERHLFECDSGGSLVHASLTLWLSREEGGMLARDYMDFQLMRQDEEYSSRPREGGGIGGQGRIGVPEGLGRT